MVTILKVDFLLFLPNPRYRSTPHPLPRKGLRIFLPCAFTQQSNHFCFSISPAARTSRQWPPTPPLAIPLITDTTEAQHQLPRAFSFHLISTTSDFPFFSYKLSNVFFKRLPLYPELRRIFVKELQDWVSNLM